MQHLGTHHAAERKRLGHPDRFDDIMVVVGILGALTAVPQIIAAITAPTVVGISLTAWILNAVSSVIWLFYGIRRRSWPLIASNILWVMFDLMIVSIVLWRAAAIKG